MALRLGLFILALAGSIADARLQEEATLAKVSLHSLTQQGSAEAQAEAESPSILLIAGWLLSLVTLVALLWASGRQLLVLKVLLAQERQRQDGRKLQGDVETQDSACEGSTDSNPDKGLEAQLGSFFSTVLKERGAVAALA
mmetsp:Transcript_36674/g.84378  ORF Transcript_36674/g.84378 Transcript_36674/m.84378 type:complete len:141 (-) Transcript_36674:90-512(-)